MLNLIERLTSDPFQHEHRPKAIEERLEETQQQSYIGDAILGGIDGGVTTFALIAGSIGGGFSGVVILVLGFAKLLADGFSMAVSNYLSTKSRREQVERARQSEYRHIERFPEGEREEIRQIYARKGFEGETLEKIVNTLTQDKDRWVDTMVTEEFGMQVEGPSPARAGVSTFFAFLVVGLVPLLPFLLPGFTQQQHFWISIGVTAVAFFAVGLVKGLVLNRPLIRSGLETLLIGGGAALMAFGVGSWLRQTFGAV